MNHYFYNPKQSYLAGQKKVGGKAYGLSKLSLFINSYIPEWYVLNTQLYYELIFDSIFKKYLIEIEQDRSLLLENRVKLLQHITNKLNKDIRQNLFLALKKLNFIENNQFFSIRSSVCGEDGSKFSFAGQMDSFLYQKGFDSIIDSIILCIKSAFSKRALEYRLNNNLKLSDISPAVIIQKMIPSEKSGVMFTVNPISGNRKEFLISSCYGLGEGVVSGLCECDEHVLSLTGEIVEQRIKEKDFEFRLDEKKGDGSVKVDLDDALKNKSCLSENELKLLFLIGEKLKLEFQDALDIEWAIINDSIYILQARAVTSITKYKSKINNLLIFDNSNIQESFCGVTTPLTFSYASLAYFQVYSQLMGIMGLPNHVIKENENRHKNMLAFIDGHIFYNINNWYEGLKFLPSFKQNKADMEKMMGLEDPVDFVINNHFSFYQKIKKLPILIKVYTNLIFKFFRIDKVVTSFLHDFNKAYDSFNRNRLSELSPSELISLTDEIRKKITEKWHAPIINDFYVMMMNGKVIRLLHKFKIKNESSVLAELLSGEEDLASSRPTHYLIKLALEIKQNSELNNIFNGKSENIIDILYVSFPIIHKKVMRYIHLYGDRNIGELKLETISVSEDPAFLIQILKNFILKDEKYLKEFSQNEKKLRGDCEEKIFPSIQNKFGLRNLKHFKKQLNRLRSAIKYREEMRFCRTRVFGLSRSIFNELGKQLSFFNKILDPKDIFFLTLNELDELRDGRSVTNDLKTLIQIRKKEFENNKKSKPPAHHLHLFGIPSIGNSFDYPFNERVGILEQSDDGKLVGVGCYPGIVEAKVRKILGADENIRLDGEILCTIRTDPGWAPLFPSISGLLVERGSTLSHSAIIARELGLPTIVGIPNLTKLINDCDVVRMDGSKGTVKKIN